MAQKHPADDVLRRFLAFWEPRTTDEQLLVREYRLALEGWSAVTLNKAADRLLKTSKWFPKPAEIIEECERIVESERKPAEPRGNWTDWTAEALKTADKLIQCDMGRRASQEGWITQLHDFCRKKRRLPGENEIRVMIKDAREFEDAYAFMQSDPKLYQRDAILKLGDMMLAKRTRLGLIANGQIGSITDRSRAMTGERE